jgi:predicted site-specific integrase-resolvase
MNEEQMYTGKEICDMFKISPMTLYNWRKTDKIKYIKFSHKFIRYYIPEWYHQNKDQ